MLVDQFQDRQSCASSDRRRVQFVCVLGTVYCAHTFCIFPLQSGAQVGVNKTITAHAQHDTQRRTCNADDWSINHTHERRNWQSNHAEFYLQFDPFCVGRVRQTARRDERKRTVWMETEYGRT